MTRGSRQIEHTADLALELWGDSEVDVLISGMEAVVSIVTDGASIGGNDVREVEVDAIDGTDRLVRWLNEVLYQATVQHFVPCHAQIVLHDEGLRATLRGEAGAKDRLKTEIKSATYHDVQLEPHGSGWTARVVLDV